MNKGIFRSIFFGLLMALSVFTATAQNQSTIYWYFGNSGNGFRFIRPDYNAEALTIPNNLGQGMSAVATDPVSGVVLFYTDGINVFDREHNLMPNGTGLQGDPSRNQGVAICANPDNPDQYFIFTNDGNIRVTTVDMSLNAPNAEAIPLGQVTNKNQPVTGLAGTYDPGLIIVPNFDLNGFWLVAHEQGGNYVTIQISNTGFAPGASIAITNAPTIVDNISYNKERESLALAPQNSSEEAATIQFNRATGQFTGAATVITGTAGSTQPYNIYDTEWSADGRFLYLSGNFNGANDQLMQVDLTEATLTLRPVPTQNMQRSYGLQIAPDSSIYHLYRHTNGSFRAGRINDPDTIASQTRYTANAFGGNINYNGRQFPAFLPPVDPMVNATIEIAGTCANVPTLFFPTIEPGADSVQWDFGDGNGSGDLAPFHTYEQGGPYNIGLIVYLNGEEYTFSSSVQIANFDLQISGFPDSDTVCAEDFPVEYTAESQSAGGGNQGAQPTFRWSNQPVDGPTTVVDSAGNYYVTATDAATGCVAYQALRVVEYRAIEQRAFIWYFGEHAGIDFNPVVDQDNPGPARPIPYGDPDDLNGGNEMIAPEGTAIYCDQNGQPLFYSDGVNIYDRERNLIASDIGGSQNASQSVFIVEFPNDATLYYVFLAREVYDPAGNMAYELSYVVFDLKQRNGLGDLLRDQTNAVLTTPLYSPNTERITGNQNWVVTHEWGNSNFRVYPVNAQGVGSPVISNVGTVHNSATNETAQGYMKLAPTGKLAVAVSQSPSENYIELFDFDNTSGAISNPLRLDLEGETGQVYGVEFSSDYRKIYATIRTPGSNGPSKVYRWQIDTTTVAGNETDESFIINSRNLVAEESGEDLGAMQRGPDGQIYIARYGSPNLATITNPNAELTTSPIQDAGFQLNGFGLGDNLVDGGPTLSLLGLPNFASQYATTPQEISAEVFSGCIGETLTFNVINAQSLESYRWNVYEVNGTDSILVASGNGESFDFSSMNPGTYSVRVDVIPDCQIVSNPPLPATATFQIYADPIPDITNVINPSSCGNTDGEFTINIPDGGSYAFELSGPIAFVSDTLTGPVSEVVTGLPAGTYNVYAINTETGCQGATSVVLTDTGVRFALSATPSDATCDLDDGSVTVELTPDAGYAIGYPVNYTLRFQDSDDGLVSDTYDNSDGLESFTVSEKLLAGVYNLEVTELTGDGCTQTLENIVIGSPPEATLDVPEEVVVCDVNEADIPFTTNAPGISVVEPAPGNYEILNGQLRVFAEGEWILETTEPPSATVCATTASVQVIFAQSDPLPSTIERSYTICPEDPEEENRYATIDPGNATYTSIAYFDPQGSPITGSGPDYVLDGDVLTVYLPGPVTVEITNAFGCVTRETIDVLVNCQARINAPDAFRPNSPIADNQVWRVYPFLVSEDDFQIFIFNRWGEMIAQSNDLNFEWNGGYDNNEGRPVPGGTYAYKVVYKSIYENGQGTQEERGAILLIR